MIQLGSYFLDIKGVLSVHNTKDGAYHGAVLLAANDVSSVWSLLQRTTIEKLLQGQNEIRGSSEKQATNDLPEYFTAYPSQFECQRSHNGIHKQTAGGVVRNKQHSYDFCWIPYDLQHFGNAGNRTSHHSRPHESNIPQSITTIIALDVVCSAAYRFQESEETFQSLRQIIECGCVQETDVKAIEV
ncbi:hypothetical protein pdam_00013496 [Pocillopora damicornis]|uniref:Uncharacterized protein n=1 Tax=Pocillopora damicornis TaxID=46731 RepID=A0A3M6TJ42_POCDA|nr:hypothetical protein pdam_00013496 [Pocillopora damicornis]